MVRPAVRRALVHWAGEAYQVSERRACRAVGVQRSRPVASVHGAHAWCWARSRPFNSTADRHVSAHSD
jgi:hypothetical protein